MKKTFALLLAATMLLSACGGSKTGTPTGTTSTAAPAQSAATTTAPPEPTPPPYNVFDYAYGGFKVGVPKTMPGVPEDSGTYIVFSDPDGAWTIRLTPESVQSTELEKGNLAVLMEQNKDFGYFQDVSLENTSVGGYDAVCFSLSRNPDWDTKTNASSLMFQEAHQITLVDFGDATILGWGGVMIDLSGAKTSTTPLSELLADPDVQTILENIEFYEPSEGRDVSIPGISVTFPARWSVGDNGKDTLWASIKGDRSGTVYFGGSIYADPEEAAGYAGRVSGDIRTLTYDGTEYITALRHSELEDAVLENLEFYTAFTGNHALQVKLSLAGAGADEFWAYADSEEFREIMASVHLDPDAYQEPEADRKNADGYECNSSGEITTYTGTETDLVLPAVIGSNEIVGINARTFKDNTAIHSVVIPEGVQYIEFEAFQGCTGLESVTLPNSLVYIDSNAFSDCTRLKDVAFGNGISVIEAHAFEYCESLHDVVLPVTMSKIGGNAFSGAGDGAGEFSCMADGTFYDSSALSRSAFKSVVIGPNADLSSYAILADAVVDNLRIGAGCAELGDQFMRAAPGFEDKAFSVELNGVKKIGSNAFAQHKGLTAIDLTGCEELGEDCFEDTGLTEITIPGTVKEIPEWAFASCVNLMNVTLEEGVEVIHANAFNSAGRIFRDSWYQTLLTEEEVATFSDKITSNGAPEYDRALTVTLPSTLTTVEEYAFNGVYIEGLWMLWCGSVEQLPAFDTNAFSGGFIAQAYFTEETINACGNDLDAYFAKLKDAGEPCWYYENKTLYWSEEPLY